MCSRSYGNQRARQDRRHIKAHCYNNRPFLIGGYQNWNRWPRAHFSGSDRYLLEQYN